MCKLRSALVGTVALALLAWPGAIGAQTTDPRAEVRARLDSLYPLLEEARVARDRAEAVRDSVALLRERPPQDTVRVGLLTVVATPEQADLAREVMTAVWRELEGKVTHSPSLEATIFGFNRSRTPVDFGLAEPHMAVEAPVWAPRQMLLGNARQAVGSVLGRDLRDTPLHRWASDWAVRPPSRPEGIYRDLVVTASASNRRCLEGDAAACWASLGLDLPEAPARVLYTADEVAAIAASRHATSSQQSWSYADTELHRLGEACVSRADVGGYDACWEYVEMLGARAPQPLGPAARQSLAALALELGGPGAYDRLVANAALGPSAALSAASGLGPDELAAAWQDWVVLQRSQAYAGLGRARWAVLFWFLFFGLLAMRSTRWRSA